jgi:ubiquitin-fold modifier 1
MSKGNKVTFKVILTSEMEQPYKVISVPEEAPFSAVIRYVCDEVSFPLFSSELMKKPLQF